MRRAIFIFGCWACLLGLAASCARAQSGTYSELPPARLGAGSPGSSGVQQVDGVAARIEDDVITESEVRELGAFQLLVDGKSKSRVELISELSDQWLIRTEANATKYAQPPEADVDRAYEEFVKQFPSPEEFQKRCASAGLTEAAIRRMLRQQLHDFGGVHLQQRGQRAEIDDVLEQLPLPLIGVLAVADLGQRHAEHVDVAPEF